MIQKKLKEVVNKISWKKYIPKGETTIIGNEEYMGLVKRKIQKQRHWLQQKSLLDIN